MPIRLSDLSNDRQTVTVRFDSGDLSVTYKPSAMNGRMEATRQEYADKGETLRGMAESMALYVLDWDLQGDDDQKLPVNADTLMALGLPFMAKVDQAIADHAFPNRQRGRR